MFKPTTLFLILSAILILACGDTGPSLLDSDAQAGRGGRGGYLPGSLYLSSLDNAPTAEATTSLTLNFGLRQAGTHGVTPNETVTFSLVDTADSMTTLSSTSAITNETGVASVDLRLGAATGTVKVLAEHPQAGSFQLDVLVTEATSGTIRVDIQDPGNSPVALSPYRVSWFDSADLRCADAKPRQRLPEPLLVATTPTTAEPVVQYGFAPQRKYTVIVEALGTNGVSLAQGCEEEVDVFVGTTTAAMVRLDLIPIQPSGTFEVDGTWDFSEALASQNSAASIVVGVIEFMADPGAAIYQIILDEFEDAVGVNIDLILDVVGVKDRVIDYINQQIFKHAGTETYTAMAADLSSMLNTLEVRSELVIEKTDADFGFRGRESWKQITVYWTWRCQESTDPDCGQHTIDAEEDGLGIVSYDWTGRVEDYNRLVIESHEAQVDAGALLLLLLENVMLPELTRNNAHSVEEALSYWIDCGTLARRATNGRELCDPSGVFCLGPDLAESACEAAVGALASRITAPIRDASQTIDLQLSGTAKLVDASQNGVADVVADGKTNGTLNGTSDPVTVTWSAGRPD